MPDESTVFERIDDVIEPFDNYKQALEDLRDLPRGYALCFAFHYVHSDIFNGGISQLYGNSTWCLILSAIDAADTVGSSKLATVLREIVYYYHRKGRSKLKRRITDDYFNNIPRGWNKSLEELEEEYLELEPECEKVVSTLCHRHEELFDG
ncbi:MAG: DUF4375 domain-containing protein [Planctomycetia bacterium]|nr:DUF4375 domain-containing protein [Planctomycetia bacterium]